MRGVRFLPPTEPLSEFRHNAETTQDVAIVLCGGGDPFAEYAQAVELCQKNDRKFLTIAGNDMISEFGSHIDHAATLHPDKLAMWLGARMTKGLPAPGKIWSHRPFPNVTNWTRDWAGSTGLFCVKVAREIGHTHVILCGVHMTVEGNHFVRKTRWDAANGFIRGWTGRLVELKGYVRSYGGWTREVFGVPDDEWITQEIADTNRYLLPGVGMKA